ncbi:MAG: PAS domain-containing protein, partial [Desulfovibrio sp.]|nr:PAS domain-containing protein [Desulfovibrio sp.]
MGLFRKFSASCILAAMAGAVLAWAVTAAFSGGQGGAALIGTVAAAVFTACGLGLAARFIFLRPLTAVEQGVRDLAEGRLTAARPSLDRDLPGIHAALDAALAALKFERGLSRGVFQGLPMPYLLVDTQERTTSTNQACLDMLEIDDSVESCLGKTLAELFYNDPKRETAVGKSIRNGEYFRNLDLVITGHRGRGINVLANIFPIYDEDKTCIGGLCLYVDMTALKQAERAITDKNERMAVAAQSLEEAVGRLSGISGGLSRGIQQSDSGAAMSAERLSEAATAMNEMNATVQEVAR